jgi:predicted O-linked N-acetylglucosamine transferase (SPINDLY family)
MTLPTLSPQPHSLALQAAACLAQSNYEQAAALYEQLIAEYPDDRQYYWYLGLAQLLQEQEADAQLTWMAVMAEADSSEVDEWTAELVKILEAEAERQADQRNTTIAWVIRQHIQEATPDNIHNLLKSLLLSIESEKFTVEELVDCGIIERLQAQTSEQASEQVSERSSEQASEQLSEEAIDPALLFRVLEAILNHSIDYAAVFDFTRSCLPHLPDTEALIHLLMDHASEVGYIQRKYALACRYGEIALELDSSNIKVLSFLSYFYIFDHAFERSVQVAQRYYDLCQTPEEKLLGNAALIRALIKSGGNWQDVTTCFEQQKGFLQSWLDVNATIPDQPIPATFLTTSFTYFQYLADNPTLARPLQNRVAHLCQASLEAYLTQRHGANYRQTLFPSRPVVRQKRPLRIGYMSCFLRRHSIGWLARWLFQHHDRDRFEVYAFFMQHKEVGPFTQKWYVQHATRAACLSENPLAMAQFIHDSEIDILIDLDSLTFDHSCTITALKPAPVQATWLGWDSSGIPAVDYFIADRYVLPESAQDYYPETIWRLPKTYIAVDGFEVGIPTIRRDQLGIPNDAVVYFSSQGGQKRNPHNIRLQLQIIKNVPNSYFLVKGFADQESVRAMFQQLAEEQGVPLDRLRFLPPTPDEETHRANLAIADVVLDTFPYNGATTTLETLWMGIPLVTRVGQQFAARNSYTMMNQVGVSEGIVYTDEEYVEWGIRLGYDAALRQQIGLRLKQSRQTSPLWNAREFTRDMEQAYEQMWEIYSDRHAG